MTPQPSWPGWRTTATAPSILWTASLPASSILARCERTDRASSTQPATSSVIARSCCRSSRSIGLKGRSVGAKISGGYADAANRICRISRLALRRVSIRGSSVLLEELKPGLRIEGLIPAEVITVIYAQWHGSDALELTYKTTAGSLGQQVVFRKDEGSLSIAQTGSRAFDAPASEFKLVAEAQG